MCLLLVANHLTKATAVQVTRWKTCEREKLTGGVSSNGTTTRKDASNSSTQQLAVQLAGQRKMRLEVKGKFKRRVELIR